MTRAEFVRAASATLKAALTLISPGLRERLNVVSEWAAEVFPPLPEYEIPQRDLQRQFDSVIDRSAKYLENLSQRPEYDDLAANDVAAALLAATDTVEEASQFLTADQLIRRALTPTDAARLLSPALETRLSNALVPDGAQRLARLMLDVCCYQLVNWAIALPAIQNLASWTILANSMSLINTTQEILQDLRRTGLAQAREPDRIITAQRRDVASLLGKMELFGLPVEARYRLIPISVSYVMAVGTVASSANQGNYPFTEIVVGALRGRGRRRYMVQSLRLLVVGGAGSGKTTAAQWLAHQSAVGTLGELSPTFSSTIPIFVRLRNALTNDSMIPPDSALIMSGQLRDTLGADWIESLSEQYEPLIVLDGWDEVKIARRPLAAAWLKSLSERFPHGHIVVTTRPDGASDPIFDELDFRRADLSPLTPERRRQIVDRWFDGLKANLAQSPELDDVYLADARIQIARDLSSPLLAEVADTPLFTAMLCCLYATTRMRGPLSRGSLFQTVANALIHYRDEQQEVHTGIWNDLELGHKEIVLGEIAVIMAEKGLLELPQCARESSPDSIESIVAAILPTFGLSASHKEVVSDSMMNRSVVLRPVGDNAVEFVHRTFQDYFAGTLLARRWAVTTLISLAEGDERLLSMLPFAAFVAGASTANGIMSWLLKISDTQDAARRRQILNVIVECLAATKQLDPDLRAAGVRAVKSLFPPNDMVEARALARLGDAAVAFLKADLWPRQHDECCIDALVRIGSPQAVAAIAEYAHARGEANAAQLAAAWERIADPSYPDLVLGAVPSGLELSARTRDRLRQTRTLRGTTAITCESVDISDEAIEVFRSLPNLRTLSLSRCTGLMGDGRFAGIGGLAYLSIVDLNSKVRWSRVGPSTLKGVTLERVTAPGYDWAVMLGSCRELEVLRLHEVRHYDARLGMYDISMVPDSAIAQLPQLRVLDMTHTKYGSGTVSTAAVQDERLRAREISGAPLADLNFVSQCRGIRVLRISEPLSEAGVRALYDLPELRELDITLAQNYRYAQALPWSGSLVRLAVNGGLQLSVPDLSGYPRLCSARLRHCNVPSIASMRLPGKLREIYLQNCDGRAVDHNARETGDTSGVTSIEIVAGVIDSLDFLIRFPALRRLVLRNVNVVWGVAGISAVPSDCEITIEGLPPEIDDDPIEELRAEHRCYINYERRLTWDSDFDGMSG